MGKHYVPQYLLKRFQVTNEPRLIWMYDQKLEKFTKPAIKKIAQEPEYYESEVETALTQEVENPGNCSFDRILTRDLLTESQRRDASRYILNMLTRGPVARSRSTQLMRPFIQSHVNDLTETLELAESIPDTAAMATKLREKDLVGQCKEIMERQNHQLSRIPYRSRDVEDCIEGMRWIICESPPDEHFVTSDAPAHHFAEFGLCQPRAEITFPISPRLALVAISPGSRCIEYKTIRSDQVKEINRRMIAASSRFIFSYCRADWIENQCRRRLNISPTPGRLGLR